MCACSASAQGAPLALQALRLTPDNAVEAVGNEREAQGAESVRRQLEAALARADAAEHALKQHEQQQQEQQQQPAEQQQGGTALQDERVRELEQAVAAAEERATGAEAALKAALVQQQQQQQQQEQQPQQPTDTQGGGNASTLAAGLRDWGYQPSVPDDVLDKGIVSYGSMARARRVVHKMLQGDKVHVAVLGGSITWGQGASQQGETDWGSFFSSWAHNASLGAVEYTNRAIPATPSSYMVRVRAWARACVCVQCRTHRTGCCSLARSLARCPGAVALRELSCARGHRPCNRRVQCEGPQLGRHLRRGGDRAPPLSTRSLHSQINDGGSKGDTPIRRSHERLLRKLLAFPNRPAVMELVFYRCAAGVHAWWEVAVTSPPPARNLTPFHVQVAGTRTVRERGAGLQLWRWAPGRTAMPSASSKQSHESRRACCAGDNELGLLAQYYHLPWFSTRSLMWDTWAAKGAKVRAGAGGRVAGRLLLRTTALPPHPSAQEHPDFMNGPDHPNDLGHRYMADMVIAYLRHIVEDLGLRPYGQADKAVVDAPLPPPMFKVGRAQRWRCTRMAR